MRTIIVGVDDSETARRAAQVAAELARDSGAALHVVCAYAKEQAVGFTADNDHWHLTASAVFQARADQVAAELSQVVPGVTGSAVEGKPAEALVAAAEGLGADLIVVGNKRVQGPSRVLGSIATGVARHAPCDVYIAYTAG